MDNAAKINIPIRKNFLFFFRKDSSKKPSFVKKIIKIGNSNESPLAISKNMVSFIYSEYLDSSWIGNEPSTKFSYDIKNDHIKGIRKKYAKITPKKKKLQT